MGCKNSTVNHESWITGDMVLPEFIEDKYFSLDRSRTLTFSCVLSQISIHQLYKIKDQIKLYFDFADNFKFETQLFTTSEDIALEIEEKFTLKMTLNDLKSKSLRVEIRNEKDKVLGKIEIEMMVVAFGPVRH